MSQEQVKRLIQYRLDQARETLEYSRMLHFAFERRQSNDYGEFSYIDQGEAEIALSDAKSFVEAVENYLIVSLSNLDEPTK